MSYVCIQSEPACWTVGFYDPDGEWQSESDHSTPDGAWARVAYLNGGGDALELRGAIQQLKERVTMLEMSNIDLRTAVFFAPQATAELTSEPAPMLTALQAIAVELKNIAAELEIANGKNF